MIPPIAVSMIPELVKLVKSVVEAPETYQKLERLRQLLCKLTGKRISKIALAGFLEEATQGAAYTGKWETVDDSMRRMRVDGGWIYDIGRGNPVVVMDK